MILVYDFRFDSLSMYYYDRDMNIAVEYGRADGTWSGAYPSALRTIESIRKYFASQIIHDEFGE